MRSRVSYRFQIDSSYRCGQAKTMRKCYEWTRFFSENGRKKVAFSNEYGDVWTGPYGKRGKLKPGTGRKNKIDYHTKTTNQDRFTKGLCRESTSGYIAHNYLLILQP